MVPHRICEPNWHRGVGSEVRRRFCHGNSTTRGTLGSVPEESATRWAARLALVGISGSVFYVVAIAARHVLRPHDVVLYGNTMSAHSVGPYGSISIADFIALGLGALALSIGLRRAVMASKALRVGSVLVGLLVIGWVLAGIFRFA